MGRRFIYTNIFPYLYLWVLFASQISVAIRAAEQLSNTPPVLVRFQLDNHALATPRTLQMSGNIVNIKCAHGMPEDEGCLVPIQNSTYLKRSFFFFCI